MERPDKCSGKWPQARIKTSGKNNIISAHVLISYLSFSIFLLLLLLLLGFPAFRLIHIHIFNHFLSFFLSFFLSDSRRRLMDRPCWGKLQEFFSLWNCFEKMNFVEKMAFDTFGPFPSRK